VNEKGSVKSRQNGHLNQVKPTFRKGEGISKPHLGREKGGDVPKPGKKADSGLTNGGSASQFIKETFQIRLGRKRGNVKNKREKKGEN